MTEEKPRDFKINGKFRELLIKLLLELPDNYIGTIPKITMKIDICHSDGFIYIILPILEENEIFIKTREQDNGRHPIAQIYRFEKDYLRAFIVKHDPLVNLIVKNMNITDLIKYNS